MPTNKKPMNEIVDIAAEKYFARFVEEIKITNDYLKHVATLDTGLIIIIATFLPKTLPPEQANALALSVFGLIISLLFVVFTENFLADRLSKSVDDPNWIPIKNEKIVYRISSSIAYWAFFLSLMIGILPFLFSTLLNWTK